LRAYSTTVAADALGVDRRWLDNVIGQNHVAGVRREGHGVSRSISPAAILTIAVAIEISEALGTSMPAALNLARSVVDKGECSPSPAITIHVDIGAIDQRMALRLNDSVEAHPQPRRGRPSHGSKRERR
jgi:hypothetical protein